jgi:PBSX family phage portal protein
MVDEQEVLEEQARQVLDRIHLQLRREKFLFNAFFEHCVSDRSFVELRKAFRIDLESHGWGTIEWLRDRFGRLKRLAYVPAYTVRPVADIGEFVLVEEDDAVTPLSEGRTVMVSRRFQIYVQQVSGERVYFKSVGDPRTVSRSTGQVYASIKDMQAPTDATPHGEGPNAIPANELMWVSKHDPTTPCAPPDWIGNLLVVLGVREADETNFFYLSNNAIPSGLLFVHGGTVPRQTKERLEHRMTHEVRGARNSGKILVVEARPGGRTVPGEKSMQPALTFQSLREAQTNDALFTMYDQRSADRIGASFRLSPMLRGYTPTSLNRATAYASLAFAEQQVFAPPRQAFDWMVNKFILPEIGVRLLKFVSNSPPTTSTEELSAFISATAPHGTYMPSELREIASGALNKELVRLEEDWVKRPLPLTLSGMTGNGAPSAEEGSSMSEIAARLRQIEMSVAQIVTEELRSIGLDYEVQARHVDENVVATDGAETNGTETE